MPNYIEWSTDNGEPRIHFLSDDSHRGEILLLLGLIEPTSDGGFIVVRDFVTTDDTINEVMNEIL